jgi:hypothetical protein
MEKIKTIVVVSTLYILGMYALSHVIGVTLDREYQIEHNRIENWRDQHGK